MLRELLLMCVAASEASLMYNTLASVKEIVVRIEEQLQREDRLREIIRVDAGLDAVVKKLDALAERIEGPKEGGELARSYGGDEVASRLRNLENAVGKMEDVEMKTVQLRDDLNHKLRKMMNVITSLYEMNKEMKANIPNQLEHQEDRPESKGTDFLMENLDEMEKKFGEQLSVLSAYMRTELSSLKSVAFSIAERCDNNQGHEDKESTLEDALDAMAKELKKQITQEMKHIQEKVNGRSACGRADLDSSYSALVPVAVPNSLDIPHKSSCTNASHVIAPKSCAELRRGGATCDGVYIIFLGGVRAVRAYCDMTTDGGGWTVLMRRGDYGEKQVSFDQTWNGYKHGFGDVEGEFWLGNDNIHVLTNQGDNALAISLEDFEGDSLNLTYDHFSIEDESANYRLKVGRHLGSSVLAANTLRHHNNKPFSTYDRNNDNAERNCAAIYKGGWWFNRCYHGFLTGEYFTPEDRKDRWRGILWYDWKQDKPLKSAEMKIRPKNFII